MLYDLKLCELFRKIEPGENFYKAYYEAKQSGEIDSFLKEIDINYLIENSLWIPEMLGPQGNMLFEQNTFTTDNNIMILKHACYLPLFTHAHNFFEMIYVLKGHAENHIDSGILRIEAGEFCIISPGVEHALGVFSDSIVINILLRRTTFSETFLEILTEKSCLSSFFFSNLFDTHINRYVYCKTHDDPALHNLIEQLIFAGLTPQDRYSNDIKDNLMKVIFCYIVKNHASDFEYSTVLSAKSEFINAVLLYIQKNYLTITLSSLAEHFNYSVPYMSSFIKNSTSKNFTFILQDIKIKKARSLLLSTDLTIQSISEQAGYCKIDSFQKAFKLHTGMSPREFRNNS